VSRCSTNAEEKNDLEPTPHNSRPRKLYDYPNYAGYPSYAGFTMPGSRVRPRAPGYDTAVAAIEIIYCLISLHRILILLLPISAIATYIFPIPYCLPSIPFFFLRAVINGETNCKESREEAHQPTYFPCLPNGIWSVWTK
jgi:hypothetical protein